MAEKHTGDPLIKGTSMLFEQSEWENTQIYDQEAAQFNIVTLY